MTDDKAYMEQTLKLSKLLWSVIASGSDQAAKLIIGTNNDGKLMKKYLEEQKNSTQSEKETVNQAVDTAICQKLNPDVEIREETIFGKDGEPIMVAGKDGKQVEKKIMQPYLYGEKVSMDIMPVDKTYAETVAYLYRSVLNRAPACFSEIKSDLTPDGLGDEEVNNFRKNTFLFDEKKQQNSDSMQNPRFFVMSSDQKAQEDVIKPLSWVMMGGRNEIEWEKLNSDEPGKNYISDIANGCNGKFPSNPVHEIKNMSEIEYEMLRKDVSNLPEYAKFTLMPEKIEMQDPNYVPVPGQQKETIPTITTYNVHFLSYTGGIGNTNEHYSIPDIVTRMMEKNRMLLSSADIADTFPDEKKKELGQDKVNEIVNISSKIQSNLTLEAELSKQTISDLAKSNTAKTPSYIYNSILTNKKIPDEVKNILKESEESISQDASALKNKIEELEKNPDLKIEQGMFDSTKTDINKVLQEKSEVKYLVSATKSVEDGKLILTVRDPSICAEVGRTITFHRKDAEPITIGNLSDKTAEQNVERRLGELTTYTNNIQGSNDVIISLSQSEYDNLKYNNKVILDNEVVDSLKEDSQFKEIDTRSQRSLDTYTKVNELALGRKITAKELESLKVTDVVKDFVTKVEKKFGMAGFDFDNVKVEPEEIAKIDFEKTKSYVSVKEDVEENLDPVDINAGSDDIENTESSSIDSIKEQTKDDSKSLNQIVNADDVIDLSLIGFVAEANAKKALEYEKKKNGKDKENRIDAANNKLQPTANRIPDAEPTL